MCHVAAARCSLHVPEIMGKVDDEDEVDDERSSDPASLQANQDRKPTEHLDCCDQIAEPSGRCEATRDQVKEPFKRRLIEVEPAIDIRKRQIAVNNEHS